MMLEQTKDCIARLRAAGFERKDFRVRVERVMRNGRLSHYGETYITLFCGKVKALALTQAMVGQGFQVVHCTDDSGHIYTVLVQDAARGGLTIWNTEESDRRRKALLEEVK